MMKKLLLTIVLLAAALPLLAQAPASQVSFTALSATGRTSIFTPGGVMLYHTVEWTVTGGPAGCTFQLEGSTTAAPTSSNMYNLSGDITCTSSGMVHVDGKAVSSVDVNLSALSGGTSPTIVFRYSGVRN